MRDVERCSRPIPYIREFHGNDGRASKYGGAAMGGRPTPPAAAEEFARRSVVSTYMSSRAEPACRPAAWPAAREIAPKCTARGCRSSRRRPAVYDARRDGRGRQMVLRQGQQGDSCCANRPGQPAVGGRRKRLHDCYRVSTERREPCGEASALVGRSTVNVGVIDHVASGELHHRDRLVARPRGPLLQRQSGRSGRRRGRAGARLRRLQKSVFVSPTSPVGLVRPRWTADSRIARESTERGATAPRTRPAQCTEARRLVSTRSTRRVPTKARLHHPRTGASRIPAMRAVRSMRGSAPM